MNIIFRKKDINYLIKRLERTLKYFESKDEILYHQACVRLGLDIFLLKQIRDRKDENIL